MTTQAAPGELERVRDFVNTLDVETGDDALSSPDALRAWLESRGLAPARGATWPTSSPLAGFARRSVRCSSRTTASASARRRRSRSTGRRRGRTWASVRLWRRGPARAGCARCRRGTRTTRRHCGLRDGGRNLDTSEGLPGGRLPLGVLRPRAEPLGTGARWQCGNRTKARTYSAAARPLTTRRRPPW